MPLHPPVVADPAAFVWSARLRAAADDVQDVGRALRRQADDAGLVGPAGDALRRLVAEVSVELATCAAAVGGAAGALLVGRRA